MERPGGQGARDRAEPEAASPLPPRAALTLPWLQSKCGPGHPVVGGRDRTPLLCTPGQGGHPETALQRVTPAHVHTTTRPTPATPRGPSLRPGQRPPRAAPRGARHSSLWPVSFRPANAICSGLIGCQISRCRGGKLMFSAAGTRRPWPIPRQHHTRLRSGSRRSGGRSQGGCPDREDWARWQDAGSCC